MYNRHNPLFMHKMLDVCEHCTVKIIEDYQNNHNTNRQLHELKQTNHA